MIAAGDLRHRVQFRRAVMVDDGYTRTQAFADLGQPVRAQKRDISDAERMMAAQAGATVTSRFLVRRNSFTAGIDAKDRLVCGNREYDIVGAKDAGRDGIEITATARADA